MNCVVYAWVRFLWCTYQLIIDHVLDPLLYCFSYDESIN